MCLIIVSRKELFKAVATLHDIFLFYVLQCSDSLWQRLRTLYRITVCPTRRSVINLLQSIILNTLWIGLLDMGLVSHAINMKLTLFLVWTFQLFSFCLLGINFMQRVIILENENFAVDSQEVNE